MNFTSLDSSHYGSNTTSTSDLFTNRTEQNTTEPTSGYDTSLPPGGPPENLDNTTTVMPISDVTEHTIQSTTAFHDDNKVALVTDMQLHFIIVAGLFVIVVILALINLYIHYRSQGRGHGFGLEDGRIAIKSSYGRSSTARRGGGYTTKMKPKPSLFI